MPAKFVCYLPKITKIDEKDLEQMTLKGCQAMKISVLNLCSNDLRQQYWELCATANLPITSNNKPGSRILYALRHRVTHLDAAKVFEFFQGKFHTLTELWSCLLLPMHLSH